MTTTTKAGKRRGKAGAGEGRGPALERLRQWGAREGREAYSAALSGAGRGWMASNPGWREAALGSALNEARERTGRELAGVEAAAFAAAFLAESDGGAGASTAVAGYRQPQSAGDLAGAIRVMLVDHLALAPMNGELPDGADFDLMLDDDHGTEVVVAVVSSSAWVGCRDVVRRAVDEEIRANARWYERLAGG